MSEEQEVVVQEHAYHAYDYPGAVPIRSYEEAKHLDPHHQDVRNQIAFDRYGLIIQRDGDGGDTAAREGMYWLAKAAREALFNHPGQPKAGPFQAWRTRDDFVRVLDLLEEKDAAGQYTGHYRRHPYDPRWNTSDKMSRDNMLPLIAAMGAYGGPDMEQRLGRFYDNMSTFAGFLRFLNKDLMLLVEEFIKRARNQAVDETIDHAIADCALSARLKCINTMDDVGDDLNLMVSLLLPELRQNKDYFKAIRVRYLEKRPMNYGVYMTAYYMYWGHEPPRPDLMQARMDEGITKKGWLPDCSKVFGAIKWYCRLESSGNPGLANLYRPIYDSLFAAPVPPPGDPFQKVSDVGECTIYNLLPDSICHQEEK